MRTYLRELWHDARPWLAAGATAVCLLCWRHGAAAWVLEGLALVTGVLWWVSEE